MRRLSQLGLSLRYKARDPRRNLVRTTQREPEEKLLRIFQRLYLESKVKPGICLFDVDMPGYGIPDLLWISWSGSFDNQGTTALSYESLKRRLRERCLCAFEIKVSDWRKALLQAQRYRYFADCSTVILPDAVAKKALLHIDSFKSLRVGLWGVHSKLGQITKHYTPEARKPFSIDAKRKLANQLIKGLKLRKFSKRANSTKQVI
jgi:hypothetical protein